MYVPRLLLIAIASSPEPDAHVRVHAEDQEPASGPLAVLDQTVVTRIGRYGLVGPRGERVRAGTGNPVSQRFRRVDQPLDLLAEVLAGGTHVLADTRDDLDRALEQLVLESAGVVQLREDLRSGGVGGQSPCLVDDLSLDLDPERWFVGTVENDVHVASPEVVPAAALKVSLPKQPGLTLEPGPRLCNDAGRS